MSQSVTIPASIDDAVEALTGIGELITARKWERAAIVAAFVRLDLGHGGRETVSSDRFESASHFAERGIVGLSSHASVIKYVQAWLDANQDRYPRPGATRRLPSVPFPPGVHNLGSRPAADPERAVEQLIERHGASTVAQAVAARAPRETRAAADTTLPQPPFPTPPEPFDRAAESTKWMDADRWIGDIHHRILMLSDFVATHPDMMRARAERIGREADLLRLLADAAQGAGDELEAVLASWTAEDEG